MTPPPSNPPAGPRQPWSLPELRIASALLLVFWIMESMLAWAVGFKLSSEAWDLLGASAEIVLAFIAWFLLVWKRGIHPHDLGLRSFTWRALPLVVVLLIVQLAVVVACRALVYRVAPVPSGQSAVPSLPSAAHLLASIIVAPITEEFLCRGLLFNGFRSHWGPRKAAIVSAVVFAVFHLDPLRFVYQFIGGMLYAAIFDETRSLWPSVLTHASWNGLVTILAAAEV